MKLFEIFNKLTEPKNISTYSSLEHGEREYSWTTSRGNRVKLYIQFDQNEGEEREADIAFTVNNSTVELYRTSDPEIMSSVFYKIKEFIKLYKVNKITFEPYEDIDDYGSNSNVIKDLEEIYKLSEPYMDKQSLHELKDYSKLIIQNGKLQKSRLFVIANFVKDYVSHETYSQINKIIVRLMSINYELKGYNRRERIYMYAIKKYLPTWKVSKDKNYIIISGDSDEIA